MLLTANRRAFSAFDGVNSVFGGGGYAAAGVTNASEVSSLWDFADAALIWSPVSRKEPQVRLAPGELLPQPRFRPGGMGNDESGQGLIQSE